MTSAFIDSKIVYIKVQKDDGLPINICKNCLEKLSSAYDFKVMVIESNKKLQSYLYKRKNENELHNIVCNNDLIIKEEIVKDKRFKTNNSLNYDIQCKNVHNSESGDIITTTNKNEDCVLLINAPNKLIVKDSNFMQNIPMSNVEEESVNLVINPTDDTLHNVGHMEDIGSIWEKETNIENSNAEEKESADNSDCISNTKIELTADTDSVSLNKKKSSSSTKSLDMFDEYYKAKFGLSLQERNKKSIFCKECDRSFGFRYYFEIHVRLHTGNMPFKCEICGKGFAKKFILKNHKVIHVNNKPFSCEQCGKAYNALSSLISHKKVHSEEKPHICDICNKTFKQTSHLKVHLQRHKGERKCTCEICGKSFINRGALSVHMACHANEKKFSCSECGKSFANKTRLTGHFKRHLNEKPHACDYCDKHFSTTAILRNHLLIHTGAKPYSCKICDKAFRHKATLFNHRRIHTGETPFGCSLCPLKFKYKHHLTNHMKAHK